MKKVLVMVLATGGPWIPLIEAIKETWGAQEDENFKVNYYYGRMKEFPQVPQWQSVRLGNIIVCGCGEAAREILKKTVIAFEHVLNDSQFDYLFRCCCGSYVDKNELQKFLEDKPATGFYCGIVGRGAVPFASGSGYFLSRDLVELVVREKANILACPNPGNQDDVCMGALMSVMGIKIHPGATRVNFSDQLRPNAYHYHFARGGGAPFMRSIHNKLMDKKKEPPSAS